MRRNSISQHEGDVVCISYSHYPKRATVIKTGFLKPTKEERVTRSECLKGVGLRGNFGNAFNSFQFFNKASLEATDRVVIFRLWERDDHLEVQATATHDTFDLLHVSQGL